MVRTVSAYLKILIGAECLYDKSRWSGYARHVVIIGHTRRVKRVLRREIDSNRIVFEGACCAGEGISKYKTVRSCSRIYVCH